MKGLMTLEKTLFYCLGCDTEGSAMFPLLSRRSTGMQSGLRRRLCGAVLVPRSLARRSMGAVLGWFWGGFRVAVKRVYPLWMND